MCHSNQNVDDFLETSERKSFKKICDVITSNCELNFRSGQTPKTAPMEFLKHTDYKWTDFI